MIAPEVLSEDELKQALMDRGFRPTELRTATGRYWCDSQGIRHVLVPDSYEDYYPDWMLGDLEAHVGEITLPGQASSLPHFGIFRTTTRH